MYNVLMKVSFVWDDEKSVSNEGKHGVTFEEAVTVFENLPFEVFYDPQHSDEEERFIAVGFSSDGRGLVVVHTENAGGDEIRIISARRATKGELRGAFGRET